MIRQSELQQSSQQDLLQLKAKQTQLTLNLSSAVTTIADLVIQFLTLLGSTLNELAMPKRDPSRKLTAKTVSAPSSLGKITYSKMWKEYVNSNMKNDSDIKVCAKKKMMLSLLKIFRKRI